MENTFEKWVILMSNRFARVRVNFIQKRPWIYEESEAIKRLAFTNIKM